MPSHEFERIFLMPEIVLIAFSIGFVMSFSLASGDAPGYWTVTVNTGALMSGSCSTPRRWYDTMPSTTSATITIAAKTGLLIETLVIHMMGSWCHTRTKAREAGTRRRATPDSLRNAGLATPRDQRRARFAR